MSEFIEVIKDKLACPRYGDNTNSQNCVGCIFHTGDQSSKTKGESRFWAKCKFNEEMNKKEVK